MGLWEGLGCILSAYLGCRSTTAVSGRGLLWCKEAKCIAPEGTAAIFITGGTYS